MYSPVRVKRISVFHQQTRQEHSVVSYIHRITSWGQSPHNHWPWRGHETWAWRDLYKKLILIAECTDCAKENVIISKMENHFTS